MYEKDKASEFVSVCMSIAKSLGLSCVVLTNGAAGCVGEENLNELDFKGLKKMIPDIIERMNDKPVSSCHDNRAFMLYSDRHD